MLNEILLGGGTAIVSGVVGFFISKKLTSANFEVYVQQAKAKANAIENEAQTLLERADLKAREIEHEAKKTFDTAKKRAKDDLNQRENSVSKKEREFASYKKEEDEKIQSQLQVIKAQKVNLQRNEKSLTSLQEKYEKKRQGKTLLQILKVSI